MRVGAFFLYSHCPPFPFERNSTCWFLKVLITKHYGFENARPGTLNVTPFIAMDTDKEIIAIKLYDDRGFYEYVIEKKWKVGKMKDGCFCWWRLELFFLMENLFLIGQSCIKRCGIWFFFCPNCFCPIGGNRQVPCCNAQIKRADNAISTLFA